MRTLRGAAWWALVKPEDLKITSWQYVKERYGPPPQWWIKKNGQAAEKYLAEIRKAYGPSA